MVALRDVSKSMVRLPNGRGVVWAPITNDGKRAGITRAVRRTVTHSRTARTTGSLPAQGARDAAAKDTYLSQRAEVKAVRAKARANGMTPRTTQQQDLDSTRRQGRYAASDTTRRTNATARHERRAEQGYRKQLQREYDNVRPGAWQKSMFGLMPATAAGSAAYADRKTKVAKESDRTKAVVAGGVSGAATGYAASTTGGFAAKKILAARRKSALTKDPGYRKTYAREWDTFRRKEGFSHLKDLKDNFARADVMSRYPKTLKDAKAQRLLGLKNKPGPYGALMAAPAVAGAAYAARKYDKAKGAR